MGLICLEKGTGRVREWVRHGVPASYDAVVHDLLESEAPPPDGQRWDGTAWVPLPPPTNAEKDGELQAFLDSTGGRVVKALATALIKKGTLTLAEIRAEYRNLP